MNGGMITPVTIPGGTGSIRKRVTLGEAVEMMAAASPCGKVNRYWTFEEEAVIELCATYAEAYEVYEDAFGTHSRSRRSIRDHWNIMQNRLAEAEAVLA